VRTRDDGTEDLLARVESPSYFGELAPMFGLQRSATARAASPATVTGYTVRDFRATRHGTVAELLAGGDDGAEA